MLWLNKVQAVVAVPSRIPDVGNSPVVQWLRLLASTAGDMGLIPGLERSPGEGNDNPLQYPCLGNSMDRGAWRATVHMVPKSQTQLSD